MERHMGGDPSMAFLIFLRMCPKNFGNYTCLRKFPLPAMASTAQTKDDVQSIAKFLCFSTRVGNFGNKIDAIAGYRIPRKHGALLLVVARAVRGIAKQVAEHFRTKIVAS